MTRAPLEPTVSVLLPAHEADATIEQAIASALAQTVASLELIVIDDGSSVPLDARLQQVGDERLTVLRHPVNRGVSAARNTGLEHARAPLVALLDADDTWASQHLERSLAVLRDPEADLVYGNALLSAHPTGATRLYSASELSEQPIASVAALARRNPICTSTVLARTDLLREAGGWPTWLQVGEDWWLCFKLLDRGARFAFQREPLVTYAWPASEAHAGAHAGRVLADNLKIACAVCARWPSRKLPLAHLFLRPFYVCALQLMPGALRRRGVRYRNARSRKR
ncbi:MAG: glycosyltransferase family A protein [Solirubrobacteraceae bacterium]